VCKAALRSRKASWLGVEALFGYQPDRPFGEFDLYALGPKAPRRGLLGRGTLVFFDG
jgi:hypothetical protein